MRVGISGGGEVEGMFGKVENGHACVRAAQASGWLKCIRPTYPAHGSVMLCTVQCRSVSACPIKSPP